MSTFFDEFKVSDQTSPIARYKYDFPFDQIYIDLDGERHDSDEVDSKVDALRSAIAWIADSLSTSRPRVRQRLAAHRAMAFVFVIQPSALPTNNLRHLARTMGISYKRLSKYTAHAARLLQYRNPSQSMSAGYGNPQPHTPNKGTKNDPCNRPR